MKRIYFLLYVMLMFDLIIAFPVGERAYINKKTGHKVAILGDRHKKLNNSTEVSFLEDFSPYLEYLICTENLNIKLILESNNTNEVLGFNGLTTLSENQLFEYFNNLTSLHLVSYVCLSNDSQLVNIFCKYLGFNSCLIKNIGIESDRRKDLMDSLANFSVHVWAKWADKLEKSLSKTFEVVKVSKKNFLEDIFEFYEKQFDVYPHLVKNGFSIERLVNEITENLLVAQKNHVKCRDRVYPIEAVPIWSDIAMKLKQGLNYIENSLNMFKNLKDEDKSLIYESFSITKDTAIEKFPWIVIFMLPRFSNDLYYPKGEYTFSFFNLLIADAGFFQDICDQAILKNNCLLYCGNAHCIVVGEWLTKLGYEDISSKSKTSGYIGKEKLKEIMSHLLGEKVAGDLCKIKVDIAKYNNKKNLFKEKN